MQYSFCKGSQEGACVWVAAGSIDFVVVGKGVDFGKGVLVALNGLVVGSGDTAVI